MITHTGKIMNHIETQKEGYKELIGLCMGETKKDEVAAFIETLKDYNGDEEYMTTLNDVMHYLDRHMIHFIMALDWKQEIRDLAWRVRSSLKDNFDMVIELPKAEDYGEDASVSSPGVFRDFDKAIGTQGFKLGFIDTNSDEYVIVVHRANDVDTVHDAVKKMGYPLLDANSPKINNENQW